MDEDAVDTATMAGPGSDPIALPQYAFSVNDMAIQAEQRQKRKRRSFDKDIVDPS